MALAIKFIAIVVVIVTIVTIKFILIVTSIVTIVIVKFIVIVIRKHNGHPAVRSNLLPV